MPNSSETPETTFCASVLAKAVKINDSEAFGLIHDALGKLFDPENLARVEQLATSYSELPLHVLNHKIEWLQSHGYEPIDVKAIFAGQPESSSECVGGAVSAHKEDPNDFDCFSICLKNDGKPAAKKRARKGKRRKNPPEVSIFGRKSEPELTSKSNIPKVKEKQGTSSVKSKNDRPEGKEDKLNLDEQSLSEIVAEIEKAGEQPVVPPKRKKKKKKKDNIPAEKTIEDQQQPVDQAVNSPDIANTKSLTEMPTLDSGIGSGAVSAGEDKSSILSGGTVESVAEVNPLWSFESDGSTFVVDYLDNDENIFYEKPQGKPVKETSARTLYFGSLDVLCPVKASKKDMKQEDLSAKSSINAEMATGEFQFSLEEQIEESMPHDQPFESTVKPFPRFKDVAVKGSFDHAGAVRFLSDEWNKTLNNPLLKWCP